LEIDGSSVEGREQQLQQQLQAPYQGCRLLSMPAFHLGKESVQIVAIGQNVTFTSGDRRAADLITQIVLQPMHKLGSAARGSLTKPFITQMGLRCAIV
jgi:hypothetical protein